MSRRGEHAHVATGLGNEHLGGVPTPSRDFAQQIDGHFKRGAPFDDLARELGDRSVDEGDVNWLCTSAMLTLPPLYVTVWLFSVSDTTGAGEIAVPTYPVAGSAGGLVVKLSV